MMTRTTVTPRIMYHQTNGGILPTIIKMDRAGFRAFYALRASRGICGHPIMPEDVIGWNRARGAVCAGCWRWWQRQPDGVLLEIRR